MLIVLVFGPIAASASAAPETPLMISGAFHATSAQTAAGTYGGCGFRPDGTLVYDSAAMRIGRGAEVARVGFVVRDYRGPGRYNAAARYDGRAAANYQQTPVEVSTADNATTGVASSRYSATSGILRVVRATNVGRRGHWASLSGTVYARLRLRRGSARLRFVGNWQCRIEPVANGAR